jgi:hypothetical protein
MVRDIGRLMEGRAFEQRGAHDQGIGFRQEGDRLILRPRAKKSNWRLVGATTQPRAGITVYLLNGGLLEYAQQIAGHESARTTKLYDRRNPLDQVERIVL